MKMSKFIKVKKVKKELCDLFCVDDDKATWCFQDKNMVDIIIKYGDFKIDDKVFEIFVPFTYSNDYHDQIYIRI